jgi:hypothetical protein
MSEQIVQINVEQEQFLLNETSVSYAASNSSTVLSNKIIRKLGAFETYFHNEIEDDAFINATSLKFSSEIDLFANKDVITKAVSMLKQIQPFLSSKVVCDNQGNKYFAYESDNTIEQINNVTYLYYKSNTIDQSISTDECHDYWKFLFEYELQNPIDWQNGPMWRLMLISTNNNKINQFQKYEYNLIITVTHAIFDGLSAFSTLINLFYLIESVYTNKLNMKLIREMPVVACIENHVENFLIKEENLTIKNVTYRTLDGFKRPTGFTINQINGSTAPHREFYLPTDEKDIKKLKMGSFYNAHDHTEYISLAKLLDNSQHGVTNFYFKLFEGEKNKIFLTKCKEKGTKVTGAFNAMFVIAWRMVYAKFHLINDIDPRQTKINYSTIVRSKYKKN